MRRTTDFCVGYFLRLFKCATQRCQWVEGSDMLRCQVNRYSKTKNRGAVLFLAMIFLLLLAIISGTVIRTSILEFQMAGNDQFREEAFQRAEAIAANLSEVGVCSRSWVIFLFFLDITHVSLF